MTRGREASGRKDCSDLHGAPRCTHARSQHAAPWQLTGTTDVLASDTQ